MTEDDRQKLAEAFTLEHLESSPEYIDLVEYVEENAEGDVEEDDLDDEIFSDIYKRVIAELSKVSTAYGEKEN